MCWFSLAHRPAVSLAKGGWCKPGPARISTGPAAAPKDKELWWLVPEDWALSTAVPRGELLPML